MPAAPRDSCIIWPEVLTVGHSSQRAPELFSLQAPLLGKEARQRMLLAEAGWWTLGHTGLDAFISRGALPLLKE